MYQLGDYPIYIAMYIAQIILPMIGVLAIAIKIVIKHGNDMCRELWGTNIKLITNKEKPKISPYQNQMNMNPSLF